MALAGTGGVIRGIADAQELLDVENPLFAYDDYSVSNLIHDARTAMDGGVLWGSTKAPAIKRGKKKRGQLATSTTAPPAPEEGRVFIQNPCNESACSAYQRFMKGVSIAQRKEQDPCPPNTAASEAALLPAYRQQAAAAASGGVQRGRGVQRGGGVQSGGNAVAAGGIADTNYWQLGAPAPPPQPAAASSGGSNGGSGGGVLYPSAFGTTNPAVVPQSTFCGVPVVFGFHGTSDMGMPAICCRGFNPHKRHGQAYGRGEYFGTSNVVAKDYTQHPQQILCALLVGPWLTHPNPQMYVVDNPIDDPSSSGDGALANDVSFVLPLGAVVYGTLSTRIEYFYCMNTKPTMGMTQQGGEQLLAFDDDNDVDDGDGDGWQRHSDLLLPGAGDQDFAEEEEESFDDFEEEHEDEDDDASFTTQPAPPRPPVVVDLTSTLSLQPVDVMDEGNVDGHDDNGVGLSARMPAPSDDGGVIGEQHQQQEGGDFEHALTGTPQCQQQPQGPATDVGDVAEDSCDSDSSDVVFCGVSVAVAASHTAQTTSTTADTTRTMTERQRASLRNAATVLVDADEEEKEEFDGRGLKRRRTEVSEFDFGDATTTPVQRRDALTELLKKKKLDTARHPGSGRGFVVVFTAVIDGSTGQSGRSIGDEPALRADHQSERQQNGSQDQAEGGAPNKRPLEEVLVEVLAETTDSAASGSCGDGIGESSSSVAPVVYPDVLCDMEGGASAVVSLQNMTITRTGNKGQRQQPWGLSLFVIR